jgi:hypothetical protein
MTRARSSLLDIKFCLAAFAAISLISSASDASAGSAPVQLYSKSVTVDWSESGLYRLSMKPGASSCSIRDGNAFAN